VEKKKLSAFFTRSLILNLAIVDFCCSLLEMVNSLIVVPLISSLVTAAVISGIWIGVSVFRNIYLIELLGVLYRSET
jgi:hypothetical protein